MDGPDSPEPPEEALGLPGEDCPGLGMDGDGEEVGLGMDGVDGPGLDVGEGLELGDDGPWEPEGAVGPGMDGVWGWILGDLQAVSASKTPIPAIRIIVEIIVITRSPSFLNLNYSARNLKPC